MNSTNASRYNDATFAAPGFTVTNGNNVFTAVGTDSQGRSSTDSVSVNLPSSVSPTYDANGNMTSDGALGYDYDDENQLVRIRGASYLTEFAYDGKMRRRVVRQYQNVPVISASNLSSTVRSNYTGWVGFKFTVGSTPLIVSRLGRWVRSGNTNSHAVKLVASNGTDISGGTATVNTSGAAPGQFAYGLLSSPITLLATTTYYVVSQEVSGGDSWYDWETSLTPSGAITVDRAAYAANNSTTYTLVGSTGNSYVPVSFLYTTAGARVETRYIYDGMLVLQERDGNNVPRVTYTRGTDLSGSMQGAGGIGGLLARTDNTRLVGGVPGTHAYYHADGNGNVTALTDEKNLLVAQYGYDPYGNLLSKSGALADANTYRFSSKEIDANLGLYYYGYRFYIPNLQRWLNCDPVFENGFQRVVGPRRGVSRLANLYDFVGNNPLARVDPFGLDWQLPIIPPGAPYLPIFPGPSEGLLSCAERIRAEVAREYCGVPGTKQAPGDPDCREAHCIASCRISKECPGGPLSSLGAGFWREMRHWGRDSWGDIGANLRGICKSANRDCESSCKGVR